MKNVIQTKFMRMVCLWMFTVWFCFIGWFLFSFLFCFSFITLHHIKTEYTHQYADVSHNIHTMRTIHFHTVSLSFISFVSFTHSLSLSASLLHFISHKSHEHIQSFIVFYLVLVVFFFLNVFTLFWCYNGKFLFYVAFSLICRLHTCLFLFASFHSYCIFYVRIFLSLFYYINLYLYLIFYCLLCVCFFSFIVICWPVGVFSVYISIGN